MTPDDSRVHVEIGADLPSGDDATERGDASFRVLILGDFGGTAARRAPIEQRVIHPLDRDGIDAAIDAIAPALTFSVEPGATPEVVTFRELDDFHPDQLLKHVPMLIRLRELRTTVESRSVAPGNPSSEAAPVADDRNLLDRILDGEPALPATSMPKRSGTSGDDLSDFVRRAVRPHVVREVDTQQRAVVAQVDDVIAATLRVLLHDPAFQALESLWRATDVFLRRCDAGESTTIGLLDVTRGELAQLGTDGSDAAALRNRLASGARDAPWSLVIAAYSFGPADTDLLSAISRNAAITHTSWLAAAHPQLVGAATFDGNGDADDWDPSPVAGWDDLRRAPSARYLSLTLPRFLVRLPYSAENPVESFTFDELLPGAQTHESFLWGNGAFLSALVASAPVDRGAAARSDGSIGGLPLHLDSRDGNIEALPCAEVLFSQRTVMHVLARGLTPLAGERGGDVIRIARLQSIADPPAALPIRSAMRE